MGITVPTLGQTNWGQPLNDALEDLQDAGLVANDGAFLSWNYAPFHIASNNGQTSGTIFGVRLPRFAQPKTVSSLWFHVGAAAVTPTAGQCFVALYQLSGTRVGVSADISGSLATLGLNGWNLTAPVVCPAGDYVAMILQNAATPATLGAASNLAGASSSFNAGLSIANAFFATGPVGQTSMPASITMGSRGLSGSPIWAGVK